MNYSPDRLLATGPWSYDKGLTDTEVEQLVMKDPLNATFGNGGLAMVFVRRRGAPVGPFHFGHVGWGFMGYLGGKGDSSYPEISGNYDYVVNVDGNEKYELWAVDGWFVGSVENTSGNPVQQADKNDAWAGQTHDPCWGMLNSGFEKYDAFKVIPVAHPDVDAAFSEACTFWAKPYVAAGLNCMNAAYQVLKAYGVFSMPSPDEVANWTPNAWFDHIEGPEYPVTPFRHTAKCSFWCNSYARGWLGGGVFKWGTASSPKAAKAALDQARTDASAKLRTMHTQRAPSGRPKAMKHNPNAANGGGRLQSVTVHSLEETGRLIMQVKSSPPGGFFTTGFAFVTDRYFGFAPQRLIASTPLSDMLWIPLAWIRPETIHGEGLLAKQLKFSLTDGRELAFTMDPGFVSEMAGALRSACVVRG